MNAQQISLNLVAQLDQGNIQSQATQMAMNMARAIEDAFQGIGSQIAASILSGVRQGLQGSVEMLGQARLGGGGANLPITETERQVMASQATSPRGIFTAEGEFRPIGQTAPHPEQIVPPTAPQPPPLQGPVAAPAAQPATQPTPEPQTEGGFVMSKSMRQGISKGFGAAGAIAEFLGEFPGLQRRSQASGAELENMTARSAMRGDIEQMTAIQRLGGQEAMTARATREEAMIIGGEVAAAVSLAFAPVTGGMSLLLGGLALGVGATAVRGMVGFNTRVEQNVLGQTEAERKKNEEIYTFLQQGRETAIRGFETARNAGAPELSGIMAGGLDANLPRNALAQAKERLSQIENDPANNAGASFMGGGARTEANQLRDRIKELETQANRADPFMVTSQGRNTSLRQFAAQMGIGEQEFLQTMQQTATGMGGTFLGQQPKLEQMPNQIAELVRMQGLGVPNAAGIAGQLFQGGGMTRTESIETVKQMFEDAVSAGMDKAQVSRALTEMASRASQLGFGGGGVAATEMQRGLGLAQAAFGTTGEVEGPEMRFAQNINQQLTQAGRSQTAGLGKMGGQQGVERFAQQFRGLKLDRFDTAELQEVGQTQGSLEKFLKEHGANEEDIRAAEQKGDLAGQLESEKQRGIFDVTRRALGSSKAAETQMRRSMGITTEEGMERFRELEKPIKEGRGIQPQIYDFDQQTGQFFKKSEAPSGLQEQIGTDIDKTGQVTAKMRQVSTLEAGAMQAQGAELARATAQMGATQISAGLGDLNNVLPIVNVALSKLVDRANMVLAGNTAANTAAVKETPATPGTPLTSQQADAYLFGGSSSMSSSKTPNSSFMTAKGPSS